MLKLITAEPRYVFQLHFVGFLYAATFHCLRHGFLLLRSFLIAIGKALSESSEREGEKRPRYETIHCGGKPARLSISNSQGWKEWIGSVFHSNEGKFTHRLKSRKRASCSCTCCSLFHVAKMGYARENRFYCLRRCQLSLSPGGSVLVVDVCTDIRHRQRLPEKGYLN